VFTGGKGATPVSLAESRALRLTRRFGPSRTCQGILKSDHKKADGDCVATHTMEIQSYLVKKKPN